MANNTNSECEKNNKILQLAIDNLILQNKADSALIDKLKREIELRDNDKKIWEKQYNDVIISLVEQIKTINAESEKIQSQILQEREEFSRYKNSLQQELSVNKVIKKRSAQLKKLKRVLRDSNAVLEDLLYKSQHVLHDVC
ncbi:hypothetical protein SlGVgp036 [Spodoptera litura granulovirus]|uniref:Uncharacterized protein n=1 Tax=Spodoptera litura granulovirus TaxID=359919 RepID=A5IZN8_9BBAC|nr:hypothetical protein SlGVgp036 [Spodoptera litura granulovirus]ABQ51979.1 hypothetical protein SlGVgp036 [Spodoptera litura granulovirus]